MLKIFRIFFQVIGFLMFIAVDWNSAAATKKTGRSFWFRGCNETELLEANPEGTTAAAVQHASL
jgi:hypothetical protein